MIKEVLAITYVYVKFPMMGEVLAITYTMLAVLRNSLIRA
jgi:hypothetical protein